MPASLILIISPGATSRTYSAPTMSSAHVSLATTQPAVVELAEDERAHAVRVAERVERLLGDEDDGVGAA